MSPIPETVEVEVQELEELRRRDRHRQLVLELLQRANHLDSQRLADVEKFVRTFFDREES